MHKKETINELHVIAHIDMDCFYAQVDANRMGVDCRTEPFVLAQWGSLIAVNYPARTRGVARFTTLQEAKQICPELKVGEVATYKMGETTYDYHPNPDKQTHKIALEPYRMASRSIFSILSSFDGVAVEKGSVDEAYLDLTLAAQEELKCILKTYKDGTSSLKSSSSPLSLSSEEKLAQLQEIDERNVKEEQQEHEEVEKKVKPIETKEREFNTSEKESKVLQQSTEHLLSLESIAHSLRKFTLDPVRDVMEPSTRLVPDRTQEMNEWCAAHHTTLEEIYHTPMRWLREKYHIDNNGNTFPVGVEGSVSYCLPEHECAYNKHTHRNEKDEETSELSPSSSSLLMESEWEEYYQHTLLLCAASRVVKRIRDKLVRELNYDCSAGLAHNRLLAKSLSALNKPNQQTLLLPDRTASAMFTMKLRKLQGFGGKLGSAVETFRPNKEYCRDFWLVPLHDLTHMNVYEAVTEDHHEHADDDNNKMDDTNSFSQSSLSSSSLSEEEEEQEEEEHEYLEEQELLHTEEQLPRTNVLYGKEENKEEQIEQHKNMKKNESELHTSYELNTQANKTLETNHKNSSSINATNHKTENMHTCSNSHSKNTHNKVKYSNKIFYSHNSIANYVFYRIRGFAVNTIRQRSMSKSLIASKNFRPGTDKDEDIEKWLVVLASELADRYAEFTNIFHVVGNNLNIKLGGTGHVNIGGMFNKTCALPATVNTENLTHAAMHEVHSFLAQLREDAQSITRSSRRGRYAVNRSNNYSKNSRSGYSPRLVNVVTITIGRFKPIASTGSVQTLLTSFTSHNNHIRSVSSSPELHHNQHHEHHYYNSISPDRHDKGNEHKDYLHGDEMNDSVKVSQSSVISISPSRASPEVISLAEHNSTGEANVCHWCNSNENIKDYKNNIESAIYNKDAEHNTKQSSANVVIEVDSPTLTERSRSMGSHSSHLATQTTPTLQHNSSNKGHKHTKTENYNNTHTTPQRSVLQALQDAAWRQSRQHDQNAPCDKAHVVEVESISQLSEEPQEEEEQEMEKEELELLSSSVSREMSYNHTSQDVQIDDKKPVNRKRRRKENTKENVQNTETNSQSNSCTNDVDCHQVYHHTID